MEREKKEEAYIVTYVNKIIMVQLLVLGKLHLSLSLSLTCMPPLSSFPAIPSTSSIIRACLRPLATPPLPAVDDVVRNTSKEVQSR